LYSLKEINVKYTFIIYNISLASRKPTSFASAGDAIFKLQLKTRRTTMSDDYEFSEDASMMRMDEDGEATSDDPMSAVGDCGPMGAEGSKIDASKNEEDEGYGDVTLTV